MHIKSGIYVRVSVKWVFNSEDIFLIWMLTPGPGQQVSVRSISCRPLPLQSVATCNSVTLCWHYTALQGTEHITVHMRSEWVETCEQRRQSRDTRRTGDSFHRAVRRHGGEWAERGVTQSEGGPQSISTSYQEKSGKVDSKILIFNDTGKVSVK